MIVVLDYSFSDENTIFVVLISFLNALFLNSLLLWLNQRKVIKTLKTFSFQWQSEIHISDETFGCLKAP